MNSEHLSILLLGIWMGFLITIFGVLVWSIIEVRKIHKKERSENAESVKPI